MVLLSILDFNPGSFIWSVIAFLVLLFILAKFAWKPILGTIRERESGIADAIASAEKVKNEMAQLKADNEILLQQAREEKASMLKEAKEMKDKMISEAKENAKDEANKILAETQIQITHQKMAALTEVKNEVGKLVLEVSEKVLRKNMGNDTEHAAYIDQLTKEIKMN